MKLTKREKTEKELEINLVKVIAQLGGLCYKFVSPGNIGVPDRIVVIHGQVYFVELKSEYKHARLSLMQKYQIKQLLTCGAKVFVIDSLIKLKEFINEIHTTRLSKVHD